MFILILELNNIFKFNFYQKIFCSYFSFMLQGAFVVYFTILSPNLEMLLTKLKKNVKAQLGDLLKSLNIVIYFTFYIHTFC
jgi:hypothetical protein